MTTTVEESKNENITSKVDDNTLDKETTKEMFGDPSYEF